MSSDGARSMMRGAWVAACAMVLGGCAAPPPASDRGEVDQILHDRSGFHLPDAALAGDFAALGPGKTLSEDQAIDLALLNNAAFAEQMADLDLAAADLVQAGLIANPDALLLIPTGPKQLEATITAPLEALWLRDRRMAGAHLLSRRTAMRLTQAALDLVRDVRLAYAEVALSRRRLALFEESSKLRDQVLAIAEARVRAGEAVPLDAATAKVDALRAHQDALSLAHGLTIAQERLRALMGAGESRGAINELPLPDAGEGGWDVEALLASAVKERPDMMSARLGVEAAQQRAALARIDWIGISFVADANERGSTGFEAGPGFRFTLPIFNQNQGMIARADAELARARRQERSLQHRIVLEVREAHARHVQARADWSAWREKVIPALEEAVTLSRKAYQNGETPLLQVLDSNRQLLDARVREAQAAADVRRARAELERSAGQRLVGSPAKPEGTP